jgi:hypothetical protein
VAAGAAVRSRPRLGPLLASVGIKVGSSPLSNVELKILFFFAISGKVICKFVFRVLHKMC